MPEENETLETIEDGASFEMTITRGTGPRDKDYIKGSLEKKSIEGIESELDQFRELLRGEIEWARKVQPDLDAEDLANIAQQNGVIEELSLKLYELRGGSDDESK